MTVTEHSYADCLLTVEGVNLALGGKPILRDVSLDVTDVRRPRQSSGEGSC